MRGLRWAKPARAPGEQIHERVWPGCDKRDKHSDSDMTPTSTPTAVTVRPACAADIGALVSGNAAMAAETEGVTLDRDRLRRGIEAVLDDPRHGFYLVAERDGRRAGQLMVTYEWSDWRAGRFAWIQSVHVEPGARKRGVFRALYDAVIAWAGGEDDVVGVRLYVEKANSGARRTYEAVGMYAADYQMYELDFVLERPERDRGHAEPDRPRS